MSRVGALCCLAALLFWLVLACTGGVRRLRSLSRRDLGLALALGGIGYGAQAGAYFAALDRIDASLLALLVYTYPVLVAVVAMAIGREPATRHTAVSLALASTGLVLVLAGAASGALAAASLTFAALAGGDLDPGAVSAAGFGWLGSLAVVSTVGAIALFFAGLPRVGPTAAAILSTLEPVVTVGLAAAVFGESLGPAQLAGGLLVLAAVLAVRAPHERQLALSGT